MVIVNAIEGQKIIQKLQTESCLLNTADWRLRTEDCLLKTGDCELKIAY